jgi:hypothetical protein
MNMLGYQKSGISTGQENLSREYETNAYEILISSWSREWISWDYHEAIWKKYARLLIPKTSQKDFISDFSR